MYNDLLVLTALYEDMGPLLTRLGFQAHSDESLCLTVIYEALGGVYAQDFAGNANSPLFDAQDNESLLVLARRESSIVASALFQVDRHIEDGYVLRPVALSNAIVDQCETARIEAAMKKAVEAATTTNTQPLLEDIEAVLASLDMAEVAR